MMNLPKVIRIMEDDYNSQEEYLYEYHKALSFYPYTARLYDGVVMFKTVEDRNEWTKLIDEILEEGE